MLKALLQIYNLFIPHFFKDFVELPKVYQKEKRQ